MKAFLGLIGAKRAGKDTAFEAIQEVFPGATRITLAKMLKDCCSKVTNIPRENFELDEFKEKELEDLVQLSRDVIEDIYSYYSLTYNFDKHVRPHLGKVLKTPREVAQYVGTEVLRSVDENIHCTSAFANKIGDFGVITDLRFPNEDSFFKNLGKPYIMVYIANMAAEAEASKDSHASEAYMKDMSKKADFRIYNNDTLEEFKRKVKNFSRENIQRALKL